ncbi:histidine--tRNA ligase [Acidilutibacter cellobiosedens]|jgi:histidyl-tRNA synthetase|uniref:Histidine--tRNA ligase n=1 Tax=Acidilutibacter cellobiosedens TaxID=2507161 RepID=A0A410QBK7_9FIRM|nr:histidine--tRNA ligase [Acidilutibacter cellobiosedens]MBE6082139.1 histidine--tRNA ligase [Tissierellaceae bacterium]QAT61340.1 histidine--tRNA ligase [Acidilutibacter cellobiosedens]
MDVQIIKPSILPGFMELLPGDQILFNDMMDRIRNNYEKFGFLPIDTPIIEKSEVLLAKGGGETEKQIYRFQRGDNDLSLRFDLTVPLARYVAQHFSEISFPFRRYQIGKVYRGERNQKGRFREFYQCDIDIIGNENLSIINDAEIPSVIYSTFKELGFDDFTIKINNRKVLSGFFQWLKIKDSKAVLRIIDKLDKIGMSGVGEELSELGLNENIIEKIKKFMSIKSSNEEILDNLKSLNIDNDIFKSGFEELNFVAKYIKDFGVPEKNYVLDLSIARGLDYYTGTVYETFLNDYPKLGSICSGGRYDNLAAHYTKRSLPGVGISIGLSRLFSQLMEEKIIENKKNFLTKVLIIPMDDCLKEGIEVATILRKENIYTQVYTEEGKIGKKFNYADKLNIPYVIIIGSQEVKDKAVTIKNINSGNQETMELSEALKILKN